MKQLLSKMKNQITVNLPVLGLIVLLCLMLGGVLGRKTVVTQDNQYKYDSLEQVIKIKDIIMRENAEQRDSAVAAARKIKILFDSVERVRRDERARYEEDRKSNRERWLQMSDNELAKEATAVYEKAHPTPLFDNQ